MTKTEYAGLGETLYSHTLSNGLRLCVVPKPGFRKTFAVFAANYGGVDRRFLLDGAQMETPAGVAHYLEHKMFDMPDGNALQELEARGAGPNAFTSETMTAYHILCTDGLEQSLSLLLRFVSTPYFTQQSVDKERGIIGQEIRMCEDSPDYRLYMDALGCLFSEGPLLDSVAGTVASIAQITPQTLEACHRAFYRPSNMALCVVGAADPEQVLAVAEAHAAPDLGPCPGRQYGPGSDPLPVRRRQQRQMAVSAPQFMLGAKGGPAPTGSQALRDKIVGNLALQCLAGASAPFYIRLYGQGLLNASFGCDLSYAAGESMCFLYGESRDPEAVAAALEQALEELAKNGLDPALFSRQKKAAYGRQLMGLGAFGGLGVGLAAGLFAGYCPLDGFALLEQLQPEDCTAWLLEKLAPERLAMSVVLPL